MNGILPLRIRRHAAWVFLAALLGCAYCPPAHAEGVTLNFADADIRTVIKFVAGFSHKNFIVDNRVKGKVTIVSPTPIPTADAYEVFLSILEVNGYTAVESGKVVKIIPMVEGKQKAVPIKTGGGTAAGDRLVTRLIVLKHANAQQLVGILRPLVARETEKIGGRPVLRQGFTTDNGNIILDVHDLKISDPEGLEDHLNGIPGVVTNGIFARQRADEVLMGTSEGVQYL